MGTQLCPRASRKGGSPPFSVPPAGGADSLSRYNYSEATGGRASIEMGELSQVLEGAAELTITPASFGEPPADSFCWAEAAGESRFGHREPHAGAARTHWNIATVDVEGVTCVPHGKMRGFAWHSNHSMEWVEDDENRLSNALVQVRTRLSFGSRECEAD